MSDGGESRVRPSLIPFLLFSFVVCLAMIASPEESSVNSIIQAERSFSKTAGEKGIQDSFLAFLADDSVLFRPRAVQGKKWMMDRPAPSALLQWEPTYAEISGAGDMGFTTGPYFLSASSQEPPSGFGQFFSIWVKQPDQSWKVVLDAGIEHGKVDGSPALSSRTLEGKAVSDEKRLEAERIVSSASPTYAKDVIVLRNQQPPMRGSESITQQQCTFQQEKVHASKSADLAYAYGNYRCASEAGDYVHVWRKEDQWKIALDYKRSIP